MICPSVECSNIDSPTSKIIRGQVAKLFKYGHKLWDLHSTSFLIKQKVVLKMTRQSKGTLLRGAPQPSTLDGGPLEMKNNRKKWQLGTPHAVLV